MIRVVTTTGNSVYKRGAFFGAVLALAGGLAACGGSGQSADEGQQPPQAQTPSGPKIGGPRDAAAVARCGLLAAQAASSLGLEPQGEERPDPVDPKAPAPCVWNSEDGGSRLALTPLSGRSIQEYYDNKSKYADFKELTVAGHPAVQANEADPMQVGSCDIFLATKDGQVLSSQAHLFNKAGQNPCDLAQKALESSVPALPAAK